MKQRIGQRGKKGPEKNVVVNDDLASKAKGKEEHENGYCSDNRLIREIHEQKDIQWFESSPTKELMLSRGGLVLKTFLDRFRVLKKDHENKFKDVNPGRKDLGIEEEKRKLMKIIEEKILACSRENETGNSLTSVKKKDV